MYHLWVAFMSLMIWILATPHSIILCCLLRWEHSFNYLLINEYLLSPFYVPDLWHNEVLVQSSGSLQSQRGKQSCKKLVTAKYCRCIACKWGLKEEVIYFTWNHFIETVNLVHIVGKIRHYTCGMLWALENSLCWSPHPRVKVFADEAFGRY